MTESTPKPNVNIYKQFPGIEVSLLDAIDHSERSLVRSRRPLRPRYRQHPPKRTPRACRLSLHTLKGSMFS